MMTKPFVVKVQEFLHAEDATRSKDYAQGAARQRRALLTGGIAVTARVLQIGSSLVTVPLTLKYLGNERFGLWMTISSVLAMASFADFGVGNGVLNMVAAAYGKDDTEGILRAVSSGFAILSSIAVLLLLFFGGIYYFVNWGDFLGVSSSQAKLEAGPALAVFVVCFALNISMDVVQRVQLGLQQGYRYSLWQLCGYTLGFVGVICGIWLHLSLPLLVMAIAGAPIISTILNTIHFFGFVQPNLRPRWKLVSPKVIAQITKLGGLFFILQVVASVSGSADNLIIAKTLGASVVTEYSIPQRMFGLTGMLLSMLIAPFWPAYREAISRKDFLWVRRTLLNSLIAVISASFGVSLCLLLAAPVLIHWWVGSRIHPQFLLLLGLAVYSVFECGNFTVGAFLNGAEAMHFQIYLSILFGFSCIVAKIVLVRRFGLVAAPWSTVICCILAQVIPWLFFVPNFLNKLEFSSSPPTQNKIISSSLSAPEGHNNHNEKVR